MDIGMHYNRMSTSSEEEKQMSHLLIECPHLEVVLFFIFI